MCEELILILDNGGPGGDHLPQFVVMERGDVTVFAAINVTKPLPDFVLEEKSP